MKALSFVCLLLLYQYSSHAQAPYFFEEKEDILAQLWQKSVQHIYSIDSAQGHIYLTLTMADSQYKAISPHLQDIAMGFATIYRTFILLPKGLPADSIAVIIYKQSDIARPVLSQIVDCKNLLYNNLLASMMSKSFVALCPEAKFCYTDGGIFTVVFQAPTAFDAANQEHYLRYADAFAGVVGNYLWGGSNTIKRIVFVWLDPEGNPHPSGYLTKSDDQLDHLSKSQ
jgi:hypothetical protein